MRLWPLLMALLFLPAASAALADDVDFDEAYYARIAVGDIPTTVATETDGQVNIIEYVRFDHPTDADAGTSTLRLGFGPIDCTCGAFSRQDDTITVGSEVAAGTYVASVASVLPLATAFTLDLQAYDAAAATDAQINIYAPPGAAAFGPADAIELPCTTGGCTIFSFRGTGADPLPAALWFAVHPATQAPAPQIVQDRGFGYLEIVLGILVGAAVWAWLVQRGLVQVRSRKQVVQKAVHEEVAASEPRPVLEARKRVLMAGLKELEVAKMGKQIDDAVYDALKAELKREAVTAMRALESAKE